MALVVDKIQPHLFNCWSNFYNFFWVNHRSAALAVTFIFVSYRLRKTWRRRQRNLRWHSVAKDIIVLHALPRAKTCPNVSPFGLKVETYLRMANIKYVLDTSVPFGSKGKTPWITLNGHDLTDSQLILDFLNKKYKIDLSSHLSPEEKGIAKAFVTMNEEHMLWGLAWWRFVFDPQKRILGLLKWPLRIKLASSCVKRKCMTYLWGQGLGRHSVEELIEIMGKDIHALSDFLGNKKFLMGDEPCEEDCAIFGMLCSFAYLAPGSPFASMVQDDYRNLYLYIQRMKNKFFPDWDSLLSK